MELAALASRPPLEPWEDGGKIPWHDPAFSARMLREHLAEHHDAASRRPETIDAHVAWLHREVLGGAPGTVLDLGCGPGLYTSRLARLGHTCTGIDVSPASIAYARSEASRGALACTYRLADLRGGDLPAGQRAVLLLFGELHAFRPEEATRIVTSAAAALAPGGALVLEVNRPEELEGVGRSAPTWYASPAGLFSDAPHLVLREAAWRPELGVAVRRWWVVDLATGSVARFGETLQSWSEDALRELLAATGLARVERHASLAAPAGGAGIPYVLVARARPGTAAPVVGSPGRRSP